MCFCVFVFFNKKHKNTRKKFLVVFFSAVELNQRANVFLCFCVFFVKNTKTQWPNFFCLFSAIEQHQRVYVFLCFCVFLRKTQKHIDQFFLSFFFSNRIAAENQCVFCVYVFFYTESTKTQRPKIGLYF